MQSRTMSFVEAAANVIMGYGVAVATQMIVFPRFGLSTTLGQNLGIGLIFTIVSLIRSYTLRRVFNVFASGALFRQNSTHGEKTPPSRTAS